MKFLMNLVLIMIVSCQLAKAVPAAGATCNGKFVTPDRVDWSAMFPMTIGSVPMAKGDLPDTPNNPVPVCVCPVPPPVFERVGITFGYWEPEALVDVTKTPFCMVNLGSRLNIDMKQSDIGGTHTNHEDNYVDQNFFHLHWYKYPIAYLLNLLTDIGCLQTGNMDLAYMSEFDPAYQDDQLTMALNPDAVLFGNLVSELACVADAIATIPDQGLPIDPLFWCMGSNGAVYPLDGNNNDGYTPVQSATLLQERFNFKLHREGVVMDTSPANGAMCFASYRPILPKSRYRYQMVNPIPDFQAHPYGHVTYLWEAGHNNPATGNDFGFLVFRKRNCCLA